MELKIVPFEIKAANNDGTFEGIGNAFHTIDAYGEIVAPGAFADAIPGFLSEGFIGGLNHDWDSPIGKPISAQEDAVGLTIKARVSDTANGRDVLTLLRDGVVRSLSIGYMTAGRQVLETPDEVQSYWESQGYTPTMQDVRRSQHGAVLLTKIRPLYEVSPVTVPANELARITAVKRLMWTPTPAETSTPTPDEESGRPVATTEREFEEFLREAGYSKTQAVAVTLHGFKALLRDAASESEAEPEPEAAAETEMPEVKASETPAEPEAPQPEPPAPAPEPAADEDVPPLIRLQRNRLADTLYQRFIHEQARPFGPAPGARQ